MWTQFYSGELNSQFWAKGATSGGELLELHKKAIM